MIAYLYGIAGVLIYCIGIYGLASCDHLLRKVLAMNIMGSGVFLTFIALARRSGEEAPDPVPHAIVLTGIIISVSATALLLTFVISLYKRTGTPYLGRDDA